MSVWVAGTLVTKARVASRIPSQRVDDLAAALLREWIERSRSAVVILDREKALTYARGRVLAELKRQGVEEEAA